MEGNPTKLPFTFFSSNGKYFPWHWKWRKGANLQRQQTGWGPRCGWGSAFYEPLSELSEGKRNQVCAAPSSRRGKWKARSCSCFRGAGTVRPWKLGGVCSGSRCFVSCRGASLHHLVLTKVPVYKIIHNQSFSEAEVLYNLQPKKSLYWFFLLLSDVQIYNKLCFTRKDWLQGGAQDVCIVHIMFLSKHNPSLPLVESMFNLEETQLLKR